MKLYGIKIFLDWKLYDIPSQVTETIKRRAAWGIDYTTVHAEPRTLEAAVKGAEGTDLKILAVTLLTSFDERSFHEYYNFPLTSDVYVASRTKLAVDTGCYGVICSPNEVWRVRQNTA